MSGFFNLNRHRRSIRIGAVTRCGGCNLHKSCYTPKMAGTGSGDDKVLYIAEAPGKKEDKRGEQLIGKAGQRLRKAAKRAGHNIDKGRKINAVNCRPPKNRTPIDKEIEACRPMIFEEIKNIPPKVIIVMGGAALKCLLSHRIKGKLGGISKWRGYQIPDRDLNAWVCPTYHPSYVERELKKNPILEKLFNQNISDALRLLSVPLPKYTPEEKGVDIVKDSSKICEYLKGLLDSPPAWITIDYETTGLKPHAHGHEIVSCSITTEDCPDEAVAFPVLNNKVKNFLRNVLKSDIPKIAANMKFEDVWSRVRLKTKVNNWLWDSMLAAHVLDNRPGITGLKFQSYVQFGRIDYDSHLSHLLKRREEDNANSFNRIHEIPIDDLLIYNGCDTIFENRLAMIQMKQMGIIDPVHYAKTGALPRKKDWKPTKEKQPKDIEEKRKQMRRKTKYNAVGV